MNHTVLITNCQRKEKTPKTLKDLIRRAVFETLDFENVRADCTFSVLLVDAARIHELNLEFRGIDRPTDVLSFPSGEPLTEGCPCALGDMALSLEQARRQAEEYGHSYEREVSFLTAHSVLHCLGYDHMSPEEEREMFSRQEKIMKRLGLSRGGEEK